MPILVLLQLIYLRLSSSEIKCTHVMSSGFHFLTFTIFDCFKIISRSLNRYLLVRFVNKSSFIHIYFYIQLLRFQSETIRNIVRLSCAVSFVSLIFILSYSIVSLIFYFFLYIFPRIYKIISRYVLKCKNNCKSGIFSLHQKI